MCNKRLNIDSSCCYQRYCRWVAVSITVYSFDVNFVHSRNYQRHFDIIWASPDCTQYSIARTTAKTPRNFERADALVSACVEIIKYLQPRCFFIENPDSGLLKHRCCINYLPYVRVDYCMYGKPYRKRTRIWTNMGDTWRPKLCDRQHLVSGRHEAAAQRGRTERYCHKFSRDQLHRLPEALCQEIFDVCVQCHVMP